jgi:CO/xanthine dehydrogenase FAD-binding subunit
MPTTVEEAVTMIGASDAVPMAGGTDLLVHWPGRLAEHEKTYIDLSGVAPLRGHVWRDDALVLGALTTYWDIIGDKRANSKLPMLVEAARTVGAVQIQTRGTWAGNIANASPAADGVLALMALDAVVELTGPDGVTEVPLDAFYLGYKQTQRRGNQIVTAVRIPLRACSLASYIKVGTRAAQAISKVGLAVTRSSEGWRVVVNSMAPTVCRCPTIERMLDDETPVNGPGDFAAAIAADVSPIDDIRSTAHYRQTVLARVLFYELAGKCSWVGGGA